MRLLSVISKISPLEKEISFGSSGFAVSAAVIVKISMIILRKGLCDDIHAYSALAANNGRSGTGRCEILLDLAG
jgi:hypothetical protein